MLKLNEMKGLLSKLIKLRKALWGIFWWWFFCLVLEILPRV
jgi:hypothetical protein